MKINLADAFKKDDVLAYLYPAGDDFENLVPGTIESTVSGRTVTIPGNKKLVFQNACSIEVLDLLNQMNVEINRDEIIPLNVNPRLPGIKREIATIKEIERLFKTKNIAPYTMIGGQPFMNLKSEISAIDQKLSYQLNMKDFMKQRIPEKYLPREIKRIQDGKILQNTEYKNFPTEFRMKLNASSSGDGVRYVGSKAAFIRVKEERKNKNMPIILQENIDSDRNIGVNFIISSDGVTKVIGYTEQKTSGEGEYYGAKITDDCNVVDNDIMNIFEQFLFPNLKEIGRYGVGSIDILRNKETEQIKIIDPNLRFSAPTNFLVDKINGNVGDKNVLMFNARFDGTMKIFETNIIPLVEQKLLRVLALSKFDDQGDIPEFSLQVGALYDQEESMQDVLSKIERSGIQSSIYNLINKKG